MFKRFLEIEYFGEARSKNKNISISLEERFLKKDEITMGYLYNEKKLLYFENIPRIYFIKNSLDSSGYEKDFAKNIFHQFSLKNNSINIIFDPIREFYDYEDSKDVIFSSSNDAFEKIKNIAKFEKNKKINIIIDHAGYYIINKKQNFNDLMDTLKNNHNINLIFISHDSLADLGINSKSIIKFENLDNLSHIFMFNNQQLITPRIVSYKNFENQFPIKKNNNKHKIKNIYIKDFLSMTSQEINKKIFIENIT